MSVPDDRDRARAQRARARRAVAEAETALERLEAARARADALLHDRRGRAAPDDERSPVPPEEALRRRIRRIEDRMQETDSLMRRAEEGRPRDGSPDASPSTGREHGAAADDDGKPER